MSLTSVQEDAGMSIQVYPNPVSNQLNISIPTSANERYTMELYGVDARLIMQKQLSESIRIDMSGYPMGLYVVKVWNEQKMMTTRFVKE